MAHLTLPSDVKDKLNQAWRDRKLVLFLGAGVSQPYGIPMWSDLVLTLLVDEYPDQYKSLWEHYRRPFSAWLAETYGLTPVMLARLSQWKFNSQQRGSTFREYVRDMLYSESGSRPRPHGPTALDAVARLTARSESSGLRMPLIVTFNFDDLLEHELEARGVEFQSVYSDARRDGKGLPILHPHGFLPRQGDPPNADLVFAELEYHRLSFSSIHWAQVEMLNALRNYTVLFIGLSMSDPNLRRLLDASRPSNEPDPSHFLFRQNYSLGQNERQRTARTINERVLSQFPNGNLPDVGLKNPQQFESAINNMLSAQTSYDEQLFSEMGVKLIWYDEHAHIPAMLDEIS